MVGRGRRAPLQPADAGRIGATFGVVVVRVAVTRSGGRPVPWSRSFRKTWMSHSSMPKFDGTC